MRPYFLIALAVSLLTSLSSVVSVSSVAKDDITKELITGHGDSRRRADH